MKKGFTLVELSIVLVIIGLLTGGILAGQSLIDSVKINRQVSSLTQYSIAFINFKQKFKQEAGDSTYFNPQGDNDGDCWSNTDAYDCGLYTGVQWVPRESLASWAHLSQAQMLKEQFVFDQAKVSAGISKTVVPQTIEKGPIGYIFKQNGLTWGASLTETYQRSLFFDSKPITLLAIEKKLDDGVPSMNSGSITSSMVLSTSGGGHVFFTNYTACGVNNGAIGTSCKVYVNFSKASTPDIPLTAN